MYSTVPYLQDKHIDALRLPFREYRSKKAEHLDQGASVWKQLSFQEQCLFLVSVIFTLALASAIRDL